MYDPRIDAYIAKSAPFAQPVLEHLRDLIHEMCPEVEETLKWSMPSFMYHGILCGFGAFKQHCTFGFWKDALLTDPTGALKREERTAMGSFGKLTSLADLPSDKILKALIREAMRLNESGITIAPAAKAKSSKAAIPEPDYFTERLSANAASQATWEVLSVSCKREYLEWITGAKTEPTREKRLAQTMEWLAEGKKRNWKYEQC